MRTSRAVGVWLSSFVLLLSFATSCGQRKPCRPGTTLLTITLPSGVAIPIDANLRVTIDGGAAKDIALRLERLEETIQLDFPAGYPTEKMVELQLTSTALAGEVSFSAKGGCSTAKLVVAPLVVDDMPTTESDLAVSIDQSLPSDVDAASLADMTEALPDLAPPPDLIGAEDCENGFDDNGDGKIDCADPQCGAYACVPAAPSGWQGPYAIARAASAGALAACGGVFSSQRYAGTSGVQAAAATCSACGCTKPATIKCSALAYMMTNCDCCGPTSYDTLPDKFNSSCSTATATRNSVQMDTFGSVFGSGSGTMGRGCTKTSEAVATKPAISWQQYGRLCGISPLKTPGGCAGANTVCSPVPAAPFEDDRLCVFKDGDVACPATVFTTKQTYYTGTTDTRACTTCACGDITGISCASNPTVQLFSDGGCANLVDTHSINPSSVCAGTTPSYNSARLVPGTTTGTATCSSTGGTPTGSVTPTTPTTICCTP